MIDALVGRDRGDRGLDLAFERVELARCRRRRWPGSCRSLRRRPRRRRRRCSSHRSWHWRSTGRRAGRCCRAPCVAAASSPSAHSGLNSIGVDALGQLDDRRLGAAGLDQALQEAFEMQAVDQHHVGPGHAPPRRPGSARRHARRRPGPTSVVRWMRSPPTFLREIADDREAGDDLERSAARGSRCREGR